MAERHSCACKGAVEGWGAAVEVCEEHADGTLWVGNSEYGSQVNYCPQCGYKARVPIQQGEPGEPVCQAVVHFRGRFYRLYRGARTHNHVLEIEETYSLSDDYALKFESPPTVVYPDVVVVKLDGHQLFAGFGKFHRRAGRRYPDVEHLFLTPDDGEAH